MTFSGNLFAKNWLYIFYTLLSYCGFYRISCSCFAITFRIKKLSNIRIYKLSKQERSHETLFLSQPLCSVTRTKSWSNVKSGPTYIKYCQEIVGIVCRLRILRNKFPWDAFQEVLCGWSLYLAEFLFENKMALWSHSRIASNFQGIILSSWSVFPLRIFKADGARYFCA